MYIGEDREALSCIENLDVRAPHGDDVLCCIKHHMRDRKVSQIVQVIRAGDVDKLSAQPTGLAPRKIIPDDFARKICKVDNKMRAHGYISQVADSYLCNWACGTAPRAIRPDLYPWLQHRWNRLSHVPRAPAPYDAIDRMSHMVVKQCAPDEHAEPVEDGDDKDVGIDDDLAGEFVLAPAA